LQALFVQTATSCCTEVAAAGSLLLPANTPFVDNTGVASHLKCPRLSGSILCYGSERKELRKVAIEHLGREGERDGCLGRLGGEEPGGDGAAEEVATGAFAGADDAAGLAACELTAEQRLAERRNTLSASFATAGSTTWT